MSDREIRDALRRLDEVDGGSTIPHSTLERAQRRRRNAVSVAIVGSFTLLLVTIVGLAMIDGRTAREEGGPVATPSPAGSDAGEEEGQETIREPRGRGGPPPVTVRSSGRTLELAAWSYCFETRCVSGGPPSEPLDIGSPDEVTVEYPLPEYSFSATFTPSDERCGRTQTVPVERTQDGNFVLRPAGRAGTYDVTLFGDGNGDLSVTFRWTTPSDGPLPEPEATAAIVSDDGPRIVSYGVELSLAGLSETPDQASAVITVKAVGGETLTFSATPAEKRCWPEGSLYWDGPDAKGQEAAELGEPPFTYTVELTLDGEQYIGTAVWPRDEIRGNEPSVSLGFNPELPRLE